MDFPFSKKLVLNAFSLVVPPNLTRLHHSSFITVHSNAPQMPDEGIRVEKLRDRNHC